MTFFIKITLESDATYRGPNLAFEYLESKISNKELKELKKEVENKLYNIVPISYLGLYMQGALLLIIAQVGALLI